MASFIEQTDPVASEGFEDLLSESGDQVILETSRIDYGSGTLLLRWRNDGSNVISHEREISLGRIGTTNHFAKLFSTGSYYSRSYEIVLSGDVPMVITGAEEDVAVSGADKETL